MVETDLYDQTQTSDAVGLVRKAVEDCERRYHDDFIRRTERRYNSYRALAEETPSSNEEDWHSQVTTPYVLQTCEGMLATMLEPNPRFDIRPRPRPDEPLQDVVARITAVDAVSFAYQARSSGLSEASHCGVRGP